jgi:diaminopimelate decarboxylase
MSDYSKPSLVKVSNPLYAKHGSSAQTYHFVRESIEGVSIDQLVADFGSPLFVFSERLLREKYKEAKAAMQSVYPHVTFSWSYKTNYLNAICQVFHDEGAIAEVVSPFEYEKARALGMSGSQIIYNGPYKTIESLERAVSEGAQIHIDHFEEISDIEKIAEAQGKVVGVGIRLNLNSGIYPMWSRFGFNLESGQAWAAIRRIAQSKWLKVHGLHSHIGTFILEPAAYGRALDKVIAFMREVESLVGYNLKFIDMGGGFPSRSHLKGVYQPPEVTVPGPQAYADAMAPMLKTLAGRQPGTQLYFELGRHLVDEAGYLITSVVADKTLLDGRWSYVLDAGVNLLYTATWYKFKIELDRDSPGVMEPCILNGPLCMNIDVVDEAILLPRLKRFQRLILSPVGAYNVTQWMQFIQYRPAVVMVDLNSQPHVIRRAENLDDINRMEPVLNKATSVTPLRKERA